MEAFIERSNALLTARPDSTRVSTKYTHKKVASGGERVDAGAKPAKVVVKTYDPKSGLIYKYKVKKANELSRILASLGPQYFEFANSRKLGIASIMEGVEPKEPVSELQPEKTTELPTGETANDQETVAQSNTSTSKSKKKKKGKKH